MLKAQTSDYAAGPEPMSRNELNLPTRAFEGLLVILGIRTCLARTAAIVLLLCLMAPTNSRAQSETPKQVPVTAFNVQATPEPSPALRYRLLPPFADLTPGNAALLYTKISVGYDGDHSPGWYNLNQKIAEWMDLSFDMLPRAEVETVVNAHSSRLADADRAARMETCDWQLPIRTEKPWQVLLPEVQGLRNIARLLVLRVRLEIADRKYDAAIHTLQTGLAMARHVAEQPTLVSGLVGIAIANLMFNEVGDLMRAPDAPNLYWAIMALPRPLVSLRQGLEQEQALLEFTFPKLRDLQNAQLSPDQWRQQLVYAAQLTSEFADGALADVAPSVSAEVLATGMAIKAYPRGKRLLIAAGHSAEEIEKLPVAQVVMWSVISDYRRLRDDAFKWYYVPYWQQGAGPQQANREIQMAESALQGYPFTGLIAAPQQAGLAELRVERLVAAHAAVEALRMHAAAHGGQLPAQLSDVTIAPVPLDPTTGRPFVYSVSGHTAKITSAAPPGRDPTYFGLHFEVTVQSRDTAPTP
jgi:hypothetical protein